MQDQTTMIIKDTSAELKKLGRCSTRLPSHAALRTACKQARASDREGVKRSARDACLHCLQILQILQILQRPSHA